MGDVVIFPRTKKPMKEYDVFVTFVGKWAGQNGELAAIDFAKNISGPVENIAEFYGECHIAWGEVTKK